MDDEPKPSRRVKTGRLQIRCTPAERETIEQAANAAGLTVSAYVVRRSTTADRDSLRRAAVLARGCTDYGGGYRSDTEMLAAYHHGMDTVERVLSAAADAVESGRADDPQTRALDAVGGAR